jgi:hypothetical protein
MKNKMIALLCSLLPIVFIVLLVVSKTALLFSALAITGVYIFILVYCLYCIVLDELNSRKDQG